MVARAIARKGTALEKSGDMEGAIAMYNKALTEHRSADVLTKLRACEAGLKKKTEEAYFDVDKATEEKEKGNDHFKAFRVRVRSGDLWDAPQPPQSICRLPGREHPRLHIHARASLVSVGRLCRRRDAQVGRTHPSRRFACELGTTFQ